MDRESIAGKHYCSLPTRRASGTPTSPHGGEEGQVFAPHTVGRKGQVIRNAPTRIGVMDRENIAGKHYCSLPTRWGGRARSSGTRPPGSAGWTGRTSRANITV